MKKAKRRTKPVVTALIPEPTPQFQAYAQNAIRLWVSQTVGKRVQMLASGQCGRVIASAGYGSFWVRLDDGNEIRTIQTYWRDL